MGRRRSARVVGTVAGCAAMVAVNVLMATGALVGRGVPLPPQRTAHCIALQGGAVAVRSNDHGRLFMVARDLGTPGIGVWAVDDPYHPTMTWAVNGVAEATPGIRAADVREWGRSHLPTGWTDAYGDWQTTDLYRNPENPAWRSVSVGVTSTTHGAAEAYECLRSSQAGAGT
ncbi:MAG TPA: hypothetical protein VGD67_18845 [Pseudonocardiaceae bacterium]